MSELAGWTVDGFRRELASPRADVGGGTAVLAGASFGASLLAMAAAVTLKHEEPPGLAGFRNVVVEHSERLLHLAEEDGKSYGRVVEARRLPKGTEEERAERDRRVAEALDAAIRTPMEAASLCRDLMGIAERMVGMCRRNTHTDLANGAALLSVGLKGSLYNVRQNAGSVAEPSGWLRRADEMERASDEILKRILANLEETR